MTAAAWTVPILVVSLIKRESMTVKEIIPIHNSFKKNSLATHIVVILMLVIALVLMATFAAGKNTVGAMMAFLPTIGPVASMAYRWRKLEFWVIPQWLIKKVRIVVIAISISTIIITGIVAALNLIYATIPRDFYLINPLFVMAAITYLSLSNMAIFVLNNRLQLPEKSNLPKIVEKDRKLSMYYFYVFLILPIAVGLVFWVWI
ncbi:MAG: hypothetical protein AB1476_06615 [Candidatus Hadarchaeota archaeon]